MHEKTQERPELCFRFGAHEWRLGRETKLMGVLNATPDSFSDGGHFMDPVRAERRALHMEREGAHVIDVGGESSRPGAGTVSVKEEIRRTKPVIRRLAKKISIPISIDTYKYDVAHAALDEGAVIVNDIRALRGDRRLAKLVTRYGAGVILMHMKGSPRTMQKNPVYKDVFGEVSVFLKTAAAAALDAGIPKTHIALDPGFGFGKTFEHNLELLGLLSEFSKLKYPLLVGLSRKSFIGKLAGGDPNSRLYGSLAAAAVAIHGGAHILRVHDVLPHAQLCKVINKTLQKG